MKRDLLNATDSALFEKRIGICSVQDFARATGYSPKTVLNKFKNKTWPFGVRLSRNGKWLVDLDKLEIWKQKRGRER